jgi:hypothetical protein
LVVSVPFPGGKSAWVDTLGGVAFVVVADRVREVAVTLPVNPDVLHVEDSTRVVLGLVIVWHVGDVDPISKLGIVTQRDEGFLDRSSLNNDEDRHTAEKFHEPGHATACAGIEDREIVEVEAGELAGSPDHGRIPLERLIATLSQVVSGRSVLDSFVAQGVVGSTVLFVAAAN